MPTNKYINIKDVVEQTGLSTDEIRKLAKEGFLPGHKTRRGHWRLNVFDVEEYFGIQINQSSVDQKPSVIKDVEADSRRINEENDARRKSIHSSQTHLITENHYQEIIQLLSSAKSSMKIMTADFRFIKLKSSLKHDKQIKEGLSFIRYLMERAEQGISVQIICSDPTNNFMKEYEELCKKMNTDNFQIFFCKRNHAKAVIVDNEIAYIGSANFTKAGVGQGVLSKGNFEVGIITENHEIILSLNSHFSNIIKGDYCEKCHRAMTCVEY